MGQIDLREMLTAVAGVAEATNRRELTDAVLAAAVATIAADTAAVAEVAPAGSGAAPSPMVTWPQEFLPIDQQRVFDAINRAQPWPLVTHTRSGEGRPLRISDLFSQREYRRQPMYAELFRLLEIDHQIAFSVPLGAGAMLCVALDRKARDFSSSDVDQLGALRRILLVNAARVARLECLATLVGAAGLAPLSERESEVLTLIAGGLANDEVGRRLGISTRTVHKHLEHIYAKTGAGSRTDIARRWIEAEHPSAASTPPPLVASP